MSEITIKEVEATVISLNPGDVLMVKLTGEDFDDLASLSDLKSQLTGLFPNNRVMLFSMDKDHEIEFNIVEQTKGESNET